MNDFHYDDELHAYYLNGEKILSVTQILELGGLIDKRFFLPEHAMKGHAVHKACYLRIKNDLDESSLHPIIKPYLDRFDCFLQRTGFKPILELCEKPQFHPAYIFGGTPDLVGYLNDRVVVIDIKSGGVEYAKYQLAAYSKFPDIECHFPDKFSLELNAKNKIGYDLKSHNDENDWYFFLDILNKISNN